MDFGNIRLTLRVTQNTAYAVCLLTERGFVVEPIREPTAESFLRFAVDKRIRIRYDLGSQT